jgi:transposase
VFTYVRLAFFLHAKGCAISVVNALTIKRYIQMQLERNKSDKKDAQWICRYAIDQKPALWEMRDTAYFESKQLYNTIRQYSEQIKRFNNQLHSLSTLPVQNKEAIKSLQKMKVQLKKKLRF